MKTTISQKTTRFLLPLAVAAAIVGGALVSTVGTHHADAALKWSEHVSVNNGHDNNKDGLKHVDPTPTPAP